jgi:hypothetical protein
MQPMKLLIASLVLGLSAAPAQAASCTLLALTSGVLALNPVTYQRLGSEEGIGLPATISIATVGTALITVSPPVLFNYPAGYVPSGDLNEVAYTGIGLISNANHGYTSQATSFTAPNIIVPAVLTVQNRVTTASNFRAGTYETRTTITCS